MSELQLVTNHPGKSNVLSALEEAFIGCEAFIINVAFLNYSGLQLLLDALREAEKHNIKGKVLTSTYLNFTEPKAIERIDRFANIETRVFVPTQHRGFHPKAFVFEYNDDIKVFVGSSNLTQSALKSNIEWNIKTIAQKDSGFIRKVYQEFHEVWHLAKPVTPVLLREYQTFLDGLKPSKTVKKQFISNNHITPNSMQQEAMLNLSQLRQQGQHRALIVAATGSGKTYLAAFDVKQFSPKRCLFVVHNFSILQDAKTSFETVIPNIKTGLLNASHKDFDAEFLFATNLSLVGHLDQFPKDAFDYIIFDEAHHVVSATYQQIIDHFTPKFMLGMTATPERTDIGDVYNVFNHNVATDIRLRDALERELVVPFHYFGVVEAKAIDYSNIDLSDATALARLLKTIIELNISSNKSIFMGLMAIN